MNLSKLVLELDNQQNISIKNREKKYKLIHVLTDEAVAAIKKFAKENKIVEEIKVRETKCHDGYDKYGPKSNIWNLMIDYQNKTYRFHREDWFYGENEEYVLWR